jgi:hypothetical protein
VVAAKAGIAGENAQAATTKAARYRHTRIRAIKLCTKFRSASCLPNYAVS